MMNEQLDLSNLTTKQLINLLWQVKGTPQAQPIYAELNRRPSKFTLETDDPEWERKMSEHLRTKLAQPSANQ
jgi:hypothetical protein